VTVVTSGAQGCWVAEREAEPVHLGAFKVEAIDTACCGDVFHGAYAAALAFRRPLFERLRHAAAAAALKATRRGGQQSFPTADEVASFLKSKGDA
jgi:sugar/nucleoside kinase (ribokinase family)